MDERNEVIIGEARKNRRQIIRVLVSDYEGRSYLRSQWYEVEDGKEPRDLHRGFTLGPVAARELVPLLEKALIELERRSGSAPVMSKGHCGK